MKKAIGIIVLGLLFISIDLSNPTRVKAVTFGELLGKPKMSKTEKILHKLNPANYFKKRKRCKEESEHMESTYLEKEYYKDCMDGLY